MTDEMIFRIHQAAEALKAFGAREVYLFGSAARGEAGPDSDVDFLVEMEPGRSLLDMGGRLMAAWIDK